MENRSLSQTLTTPPPADRVVQRRGGIPGFLRGRKGMLIAAAVVGLIALLAGWTWLGAAAVLPLLYILPCAAMLAMCMRGNGGAGKTPEPDPSGGTKHGGSR